MDGKDWKKRGVVLTLLTFLFLINVQEKTKDYHGIYSLHVDLVFFRSKLMYKVVRIVAGPTVVVFRVLALNSRGPRSKSYSNYLNLIWVVPGSTC